MRVNGIHRIGFVALTNVTSDLRSMIRSSENMANAECEAYQTNAQRGGLQTENTVN